MYNQQIDWGIVFARPLRNLMQTNIHEQFVMILGIQDISRNGIIHPRYTINPRKR